MRSVNQHQIFAAFENIIFKYEIYYFHRTMEYEFMPKILMLIPGKFSTPIDIRNCSYSLETPSNAGDSGLFLIDRLRST